MDDELYHERALRQAEEERDRGPVENPIQVTGAVNGRRITLDPVLPVQPIPAEVRRVEMAIPAGFQVPWMDGTADNDGTPITYDLTCGAGVGSRWIVLTVHIGDERRTEVLDMAKFAQAWIAQVVEGAPTPAAPGA